MAAQFDSEDLLYKFLIVGKEIKEVDLLLDATSLPNTIKNWT